MRPSTLKRTGPPKRRRRLKSKSVKRIELAYGAFVAQRLARSRECEVGPRIELVDPLWRHNHAVAAGLIAGCTRRATGLHHLRKRSAAGRVRSRLNTLRSCDPCNGWVEAHPEMAYRAGLVVRPGDAWWPWLGVRLPSGRTL